LVERALSTRPDVLAARHTYTATQSQLLLARANRLPDLTASAQLRQNESGHNPINPSPNYNFLTVGVSFPLPIFNSYRGEYLVAQRASLQAETNLRAAESRATIEVRQAFERYRLSKQRAARYEGQISVLASKVLDARLTAYKVGGATLLDVLTAQKAETDVQLASIDAQSERAKALIALEQAAYFWDIDL
jgi:cobalt-zinc-cadmium efflux system outer membrane protein